MSTTCGIITTKMSNPSIAAMTSPAIIELQRQIVVSTPSPVTPISRNNSQQQCDTDSGKSSCSPALLDCSYDSGICVEVTDVKLHRQLLEFKRILLALERDRDMYRLLRERLSKIVDRKNKKQKQEEVFCNVCCAEIDPENVKCFVQCSVCQKVICRGTKCADWIPSSAQWECQLCHASKESLAQTSSWVAEQASFNQHKLVYPMRARSEIYIPITSDHNEGSLVFESVSQVEGAFTSPTAAAATITAEQKLKIREYVEEVVAQMLGGSLENVAVGRLSKSENYMHLFHKYHSKLSNLFINMENALYASMQDLPAIANRLVNSNNTNSNNSVNAAASANFNSDLTDISHARLRQLIETIIAETLRAQPVAAVSEVAIDAHSNGSTKTSSNRIPNGDARRHRTEHYFEPKIYQELLATAVLNKIVDTHGNARHLTESGPDLIATTDLNKNFKEDPHGTLSSGSSIEPQSDCSFTDTDQILNLSKGADFSPCGSHTNLNAEIIGATELDAGRESTLSDYIAAHMVPLPDLSAPVTESEEDDYVSITSSQLGDGNWEDNWLFKKKKSTLKTPVTAGGVGMLVPAPKEDVRAQIGDKIADEISDLSEVGSETDDSSLDLLRGGQLDPPNDRLLNKHLIGGHNTKMVLDELIDSASVISCTSPAEHEPAYTETKNSHVVSAATRTEAINTSVTKTMLTHSPPSTDTNMDPCDPVILPPPMSFDDDDAVADANVVATTNGTNCDISNPVSVSLNLIEAIQATEGCTGFSTEVEEFDTDPNENSAAGIPSVIEILAAIALGPMLAVPASEHQPMLTPTESTCLKELSDLALAEIRARTPDPTYQFLGVIPEENIEDTTLETLTCDLQSIENSSNVILDSVSRDAIVNKPATDVDTESKNLIKTAAIERIIASHEESGTTASTETLQATASPTTSKLETVETEKIPKGAITPAPAAVLEEIVSLPNNEIVYPPPEKAKGMANVETLIVATVNSSTVSDDILVPSTQEIEIIPTLEVKQTENIEPFAFATAFVPEIIIPRPVEAKHTGNVVTYPESKDIVPAEPEISILAPTLVEAKVTEIILPAPVTHDICKKSMLPTPAFEIVIPPPAEGDTIVPAPAPLEPTLHVETAIPAPALAACPGSIVIPPSAIQLCDPHPQIGIPNIEPAELAETAILPPLEAKPSENLEPLPQSEVVVPAEPESALITPPLVETKVTEIIVPSPVTHAIRTEIMVQTPAYEIISPSPAEAEISEATVKATAHIEPALHIETVISAPVLSALPESIVTLPLTTQIGEPQPEVAKGTPKMEPELVFEMAIPPPLEAKVVPPPVTATSENVIPPCEEARTSEAIKTPPKALEQALHVETFIPSPLLASGPEIIFITSANQVCDPQQEVSLGTPNLIPELVVETVIIPPLEVKPSGNIEALPITEVVPAEPESSLVAPPLVEATITEIIMPTPVTDAISTESILPTLAFEIVIPPPAEAEISETIVPAPAPVEPALQVETVIPAPVLVACPESIVIPTPAIQRCDPQSEIVTPNIEPEFVVQAVIPPPLEAKPSENIEVLQISEVVVFAVPKSALLAPPQEEGKATEIILPLPVSEAISTESVLPTLASEINILSPADEGISEHIVPAPAPVEPAFHVEAAISAPVLSTGTKSIVISPPANEICNPQPEVEEGTPNIEPGLAETIIPPPLEVKPSNNVEPLPITEVVPAEPERTLIAPSLVEAESPEMILPPPVNNAISTESILPTPASEIVIPPPAEAEITVPVPVPVESATAPVEPTLYVRTSIPAPDLVSGPENIVIPPPATQICKPQPEIAEDTPNIEPGLAETVIPPPLEAKHSDNVASLPITEVVPAEPVSTLIAPSLVEAESPEIILPPPVNNAISTESILPTPAFEIAIPPPAEAEITVPSPVLVESAPALVEPALYIETAIPAPELVTGPESIVIPAPANEICNCQTEMAEATTNIELGLAETVIPPALEAIPSGSVEPLPVKEIVQGKPEGTLVAPPLEVEATEIIVPPPVSDAINTNSILPTPASEIVIHPPAEAEISVPVPVPVESATAPVEPTLYVRTSIPAPDLVTGPENIVIPPPATQICKPQPEIAEDTPNIEPGLAETVIPPPLEAKHSDNVASLPITEVVPTEPASALVAPQLVEAEASEVLVPPPLIVAISTESILPTPASEIVISPPVEAEITVPVPVSVESAPASVEPALYVETAFPAPESGTDPESIVIPAAANEICNSQTEIKEATSNIEQEFAETVIRPAFEAKPLGSVEPLPLKVIVPAKPESTLVAPPWEEVEATKIIVPPPVSDATNTDSILPTPAFEIVIPAPAEEEIIVPAPNPVEPALHVKTAIPATVFVTGSESIVISPPANEICNPQPEVEEGTPNIEPGLAETIIPPPLEVKPSDNVESLPITEVVPEEPESTLVAPPLVKSEATEIIEPTHVSDTISTESILPTPASEIVIPPPAKAEITVPVPVPVKSAPAPVEPALYVETAIPAPELVTGPESIVIPAPANEICNFQTEIAEATPNIELGMAETVVPPGLEAITSGSVKPQPMTKVVPAEPESTLIAHPMVEAENTEIILPTPPTDTISLEIILPTPASEIVTPPSAEADIIAKAHSPIKPAPAPVEPTLNVETAIPKPMLVPGPESIVIPPPATHICNPQPEIAEDTPNIEPGLAETVIPLALEAKPSENVESLPITEIVRAEPESTLVALLLVKAEATEIIEPPPVTDAIRTESLLPTPTSEIVIPSPMEAGITVPVPVAVKSVPFPVEPALYVETAILAPELVMSPESIVIPPPANQICNSQPKKAEGTPNIEAGLAVVVEIPLPFEAKPSGNVEPLPITEIVPSEPESTLVAPPLVEAEATEIILPPSVTNTIITESILPSLASEIVISPPAEAKVIAPAPAPVERALHVESAISPPLKAKPSGNNEQLPTTEVVLSEPESFLAAPPLVEAEATEIILPPLDAISTESLLPTPASEIIIPPAEAEITVQFPVPIEQAPAPVDPPLHVETAIPAPVFAATKESILILPLANQVCDLQPEIAEGTPNIEPGLAVVAVIPPPLEAKLSGNIEPLPITEVVPAEPGSTLVAPPLVKSKAAEIIEPTLITNTISTESILPTVASEIVIPPPAEAEIIVPAPAPVEPTLHVKTAIPATVFLTVSESILIPHPANEICNFQPETAEGTPNIEPGLAVVCEIPLPLEAKPSGNVEPLSITEVVPAEPESTLIAPPLVEVEATEIIVPPLVTDAISTESLVPTPTSEIVIPFPAEAEITVPVPVAVRSAPFPVEPALYVETAIPATDLVMGPESIVIRAPANEICNSQTDMAEGTPNIEPGLAETIIPPPLKAKPSGNVEPFPRTEPVPAEPRSTLIAPPLVKAKASESIVQPHVSDAIRTECLLPSPPSEIVISPQAEAEVIEPALHFETAIPPPIKAKPLGSIDTLPITEIFPAEPEGTLVAPPLVEAEATEIVVPLLVTDAMSTESLLPTPASEIVIPPPAEAEIIEPAPAPVEPAFHVETAIPAPILLTGLESILIPPFANGISNPQPEKEDGTPNIKPGLAETVVSPPLEAKPSGNVEPLPITEVVPAEPESTLVVPPLVEAEATEIILPPSITDAIITESILPSPASEIVISPPAESEVIAPAPAPVERALLVETAIPPPLEAKLSGSIEQLPTTEVVLSEPESTLAAPPLVEAEATEIIVPPLVTGAIITKSLLPIRASEIVIPPPTEAEITVPFSVPVEPAPAPVEPPLHVETAIPEPVLAASKESILILPLANQVCDPQPEIAEGTPNIEPGLAVVVVIPPPLEAKLSIEPLPITEVVPAELGSTLVAPLLVEAEITEIIVPSPVTDAISTESILPTPASEIVFPSPEDEETSEIIVPFSAPVETALNVETAISAPVLATGPESIVLPPPANEICNPQLNNDESTPNIEPGLAVEKVIPSPLEAKPLANIETLLITEVVPANPESTLIALPLCETEVTEIIKSPHITDAISTESIMSTISSEIVIPSSAEEGISEIIVPAHAPVEPALHFEAAIPAPELVTGPESIVIRAPINEICNPQPKIAEGTVDIEPGLAVETVIPPHLEAKPSGNIEPLSITEVVPAEPESTLVPPSLVEVKVTEIILPPPVTDAINTESKLPTFVIVTPSPGEAEMLEITVSASAPVESADPGSIVIPLPTNQICDPQPEAKHSGNIEPLPITEVVPPEQESTLVAPPLLEAEVTEIIMPPPITDAISTKSILPTPASEIVIPPPAEPKSIVPAPAPVEPALHVETAISAPVLAAAPESIVLAPPANEICNPQPQTVEGLPLVEVKITEINVPPPVTDAIIMESVLQTPASEIAILPPVEAEISEAIVSAPAPIEPVEEAPESIVIQLPSNQICDPQPEIAEGTPNIEPALVIETVIVEPISIAETKVQHACVSASVAESETADLFDITSPIQVNSPQTSEIVSTPTTEAVIVTGAVEKDDQETAPTPITAAADAEITATPPIAETYVVPEVVGQELETGTLTISTEAQTTKCIALPSTETEPKAESIKDVQGVASHPAAVETITAPTDIQEFLTTPPTFEAPTTTTISSETSETTKELANSSLPQVAEHTTVVSQEASTPEDVSASSAQKETAIATPVIVPDIDLVEPVSPTIDDSKPQDNLDSKAIPDDKPPDKTQPVGNNTRRGLRRQSNVIDTPPSVDEAQPKGVSLLATICKCYIKDKRLLKSIENRRRQTVLIQRYLNSFDSIDSEEYVYSPKDVLLTEYTSIFTPETPYPIEIEHEHEKEDFIAGELSEMSFNFFNNVLFSDQLSSDSNTEGSIATAVETFTDERSPTAQYNAATAATAQLDEFEYGFSSSSIVLNSPAAKHHCTHKNTNNTNISTTTTFTTTCKSTNIAITTTTTTNVQKANGAIAGVHKSAACSKEPLLSDDEEQEHVDDDLMVLRRFVPGSIAEREYKKWYNAVDMPNNPYAPEALKRRISGSQERFIDLPNISPSTEQNPISLIQNASKDEIDQSEERDYKRYSRDYYINDTKQSSTTTASTITNNNSIKSSNSTTTLTEGSQESTIDITINEAQIANTTANAIKTSPSQDEHIFQAIPAQVVEDPAASLETQSNLSNQSIQSATTSEDSDTIRIYDLKKQETIIIRDQSSNIKTTTTTTSAKPQLSTALTESTSAETNTILESPQHVPASAQEDVPKTRPTALALSSSVWASSAGDAAITLGTAGAVTSPFTPTRGSTPTAFKFLQPKRKLIDPSQVLSFDEDYVPPSPMPVERKTVEEDVAQALPSVKALAQAFLISSHKRSSVEKRYWPKVKTTVTPSEENVLSPQKPLNTITPAVPTKQHLDASPSFVEATEDATIASDLSSLETDPPTHNETKDSKPAASGKTSPLPVRAGFLKSNIAFFENLKFK